MSLSEGQPTVLATWSRGDFKNEGFACAPLLGSNGPRAPTRALQQVVIIR
jgi:hypothetical protein